MRWGNHALVLTPLVLVASVMLVVFVAQPTGWAATPYPDPYGCRLEQGSCAGNDARYPVQYTSLYDGAPDHYFLRFPDGYDKSRSYPLMLHFHAFCAGDSSIGDLRMLRQVANDNQVIVIGHWQRGGLPGTGECGASFLGDGRHETTTAAHAARADLQELLNEITARFKVSYVITAGASMGGYVALRSPLVAPDKVWVVMATVPAMEENGNLAPSPKVILDAARRGAYDDRFVYDVEGTLDQFLAASRQLNAIMQGKPYWSYHEVAGAGHENFFADDWNVAHGYCTDPNRADAHCWYISTPSTPNLWEGVRAWAQAHPRIVNGLLEPDCGWQAPTKVAAWYLTADLLARGGRAWPHAQPGCAGRADAGSARRADAGGARPADSGSREDAARDGPRRDAAAADSRRLGDGAQASRAPPDAAPAREGPGAHPPTGPSCGSGGGCGPSGLFSLESGGLPLLLAAGLVFGFWLLRRHRRR